jgi:hypothetical protein
MHRALTGKRPGIPDDIPAWVKSLIRSCWSTDPAARFCFFEIFDILEENEFKIYEGVDATEVRLYTRSINSQISGMH